VLFGSKAHAGERQKGQLAGDLEVNNQAAQAREFSPSARSRPALQSHHSQPFTTLAAARLDYFAAARGGHPGTVTNLAGSFLAVRAECWLHDCFERKRVRSAARHWGCQGRRAGTGSALEWLLFSPCLSPALARLFRPTCSGQPSDPPSPHHPAACPSFRLSLAPMYVRFFASRFIAWYPPKPPKSVRKS
jgi:hypothetical protein